MRNIYVVIAGIFLSIFLIFGAHVHAQQTDCKVTIPNLSETYTGGCKKGLAQGKGIAQGVDRYEGQFYKGMPDGKGVYSWTNGPVYEGQWVKGRREGNGKMIYHLAGKDSIVLGYWKNDKYIGEKYVPPYKITRNMGVIRNNFNKTSDSGSDVTIKILLGGSVNSDLEGFSMVSDSGSAYQSGSANAVQNVHFPLNVKVSYRTWNLLHSARTDVVFEFEISDPGSWEITLTN